MKSLRITLVLLLFFMPIFMPYQSVGGMLNGERTIPVIFLADEVSIVAAYNNVELTTSLPVKVKNCGTVSMKVEPLKLYYVKVKGNGRYSFAWRTNVPYQIEPLEIMFDFTEFLSRRW